MSRLWVFVQAYLDSQGGMSAAALARKIGVPKSTFDTWKNRGSRPGGPDLRKLADGIDVDYPILLAAIEVDRGYLTNDDLEAVLDNKRISPEIRRQLRAAPHIPSMDAPPGAV